MALQKYVPSVALASASIKPSNKVVEDAQLLDLETRRCVPPDMDIDIREVYFLIMHFLSTGPCKRTFGVIWNELLEHQLLPRRYHAWYSKRGMPSGDEDDDGISFPLNYTQLLERNPDIQKDHLVKLLKQLILNAASPSTMNSKYPPNAADVPTLLGMGSFSLLSYDGEKGEKATKLTHAHMRWPHVRADQVRALTLREIGGGFARHHRAPSIRAACYAIAKPSTMVQRMHNIKRVRGHRNAVYCAIFDRSGRYVITGSDDRLVKIWSMETAYCLASCRGHEGDITDLAVSSNNAMVASSSNDCVIRVWRLADGLPISVLRGHTAAVTAITFSPRPGSTYQLLSSSDDGTCRLWDARNSQFSPRIYHPKPADSLSGKSSGPSSSSGQQSHQIFCCAFNASGTVFVTGSSDNLARVWNACKPYTDDPGQPNHETDVLSGHENDVNYVQFSGCAVSSRFSMSESPKDEIVPKFRNSWFSHDNIVTCSRDGSAIIWVPRSRRSHGRAGRWVRHYHLRVPPPPMPPQPPQGGPRQRVLPTPRGVNMVVWSLDNRFVLAAIMDCRICVWNAADGSLVHCLTGHTESTYVLDVHPFNPRIAMSAGYDGRTIVWDIWEGKPIRTYEISRFKLVDGKFSPDGSSIILSDDVGQLYILSTGQGESKRDAKYDQFFLGDYRPLIQDSNGNILDQETQLQPYKRNLVDLLCDSGMIPYTEPYQTMYQKRRLGAMNIEWRPSSLKFAVVPDVSLDREYQMLPLADLDMIVDPLPEFIDAMEWEPEIEVLSDGNDLEYNVAEEYSIGEGQGSLSSSDDSDCSEEDGEMEGTHKDGLRRSKRKKRKSEAEIMTSSGRRVKRKILDEYDANSFGHDRSKKSRSRKSRHKKSSKSKSSRPQRAAARNALTLFSKIGTSSEAEDEDDSESDSSEIESMTQELNTESDESSRLFPIEEMRHSKGKEVSLDAGENVAQINGTESHHVGNRTKLVLRLPGRSANKIASGDYTVKGKGEKQDRFTASSSRVYGKAINGFAKAGKSLDPDLSSGSSESIIGEGRGGQSSKAENNLDLSDKYRDGSIKWGGVRARTSKRMKPAEAMASSLASTSKFIDENKETQNACDEYLKHEKESASAVPCSDVQPAENDKTGEASGIVPIGMPDVLNDLANRKDHPCLTKSCDTHESLLVHSISAHDASVPVVSSANVGNEIPGTNTSSNPILTKSEMTPRTTIEGPKTSELQRESSERNNVNGDSGDNGYIGSESTPVSKVIVHDESNGTSLQNHHDVLSRPEAQTGEFSKSSLCESEGLSSHPKRMFDFVYRRTKAHKEKVSLEREAGSREGTAGDAGTSATADFHEPPSDVSCRTKSNRLKFTRSVQSGENHGNGHIGLLNGWQHQGEEAGSSSRVAHGMRSARNRRNNYYFHDSSPVRKSHQSVRKGSWLMLTTHEEGFRYIPQLGDEIAYLRQGHQEYVDHTDINEAGPWRSLKGRTIRAIEFCKVIRLEYSTFPGSGESCCKLTLRFSDPSSNVLNQSFKLTLPEVTGFPDFIVERSRFEASISRNWSCRDKCKVWWKNEGEDDGSWWDGRVVAVKPKSHEFPDSPWERYAVQYRSDPKEPHLHSPWELFDADTQWVELHINEESRGKLLSALSRLERSSEKVQDRFGVNKLNQVSEKSNFINRFSVPISLGVIRSRLECNYYRSLEAVEHDIEVLLSNAESYFAKNAELSTKIKRLSDWFSRTLSSLKAE